MPYLICQRCGGYYKLEEDESPDDFDTCRCGGDLVYSYSIDQTPKRRSKKGFAWVSFFFTAVIVVIAFISFTMPDFGGDSGSPLKLASDYRGSVSKEVFAASDTSSSAKKTIAIITGMHPREKLSIQTVNDVIHQYSLSANNEIIHYRVNVTNNPNNFHVGRTNGEGLVATYIIPDIKKSNIDAVIICHDHAPGYGKGYFIATPKMDTPSVALAEKIEKNIPEFIYYRATAYSEHGSSTFTVSYPLAKLGIPTLVYEMPEWATYTQAYDESKKLISNCFLEI
ncbi:MAG: hypothetical protein QM396_06840 [Euryarchaeota archaeon]|jgi:hypothetical protein|uniref:hypothetical protein n=1 Tax=Methanobacterium sp. MZD130B TaxID=3394378 RepID=UPI00177501B2|nr:hypothetical protein [Euryarchaeota archaeon]HHT18934.1 hypothetical protein [Methanobacterium sp.]